MSRYEWCQGTLRMRSKDVSALRKLVVTAFNEQRAQEIAKANTAIAEVLEMHKAKRVAPWVADLTAKFNRMEDFWALGYFDDVLALCFPLGPGKRPALIKASTKGLPPALKPLTPCVNVASEAVFSIHFEPKSGKVLLSVPENNHAVDSARENSLFLKVIAFLNALDWPRGGGGEIVGNDEYNRDNCQNGGGANYSVFSFKYKSPKQKEEESRARQRISHSYHNSTFRHYCL